MVRQCIAGSAQTYGAFELKRDYQHNLMRALLLAGLLHALLIGGAVWYGQNTDLEVATPIIVRPTRDTMVILPPPSVIPDEPRISGGGGGFAKEKIGIPVAVPDETVTEDEPLASREYLRKMIREADTGRGGYGPGQIEFLPIDMVIPPITTFTPVEQEPILIVQTLPEYPAIARTSGLTASLTLRVFVNMHGNVLAAEVIGCSAPSVGFEEAALTAVTSWKFRPAIQNGRAVGVWFNVPVKFTLN